jgi:hypothetical protein
MIEARGHGSPHAALNIAGNEQTAGEFHRFIAEEKRSGWPAAHSPRNDVRKIECGQRAVFEARFLEYLARFLSASPRSVRICA